MAADLETLIRHNDIETTLRYYVENNARATGNAALKAPEQQAWVRIWVTTSISGLQQNDENPYYHVFGPVAQWLEQGTHNPLVVGSSPTGPTFV